MDKNASDPKSDVNNPNNAAHKAAADHHAQLTDPTSAAYKAKHVNRSGQLDPKQQKWAFLGSFQWWWCSKQQMNKFLEFHLKKMHYIYTSIFLKNILFGRQS